MGVTGLVYLRKPSRVQHSHARLRALQNLDFKRLTLTHAQFGLPLNLTRTRAGTYHRRLPSLHWVHRLHRWGFSQQLRFFLFYVTCGPIFQDLVTLSGLINHVFVEKDLAKECNWPKFLHNTGHDQLRGTVLNVHADTNNAGWAIVRPAHCQKTFFVLPIIMIIFVNGSSLSCSLKTLQFARPFFGGESNHPFITVTCNFPFLRRSRLHTQWPRSKRHQENKRGKLKWYFALSLLLKLLWDFLNMLIFARTPIETWSITAPVPTCT